ncbi:MAG: dipeptidase [Anaerolineales bacterium]|nr:MAG: dipeptidase [Anaerolineales bacterium]
MVYAKEHRGEFLEDLISYLRIPSVSTLSEHEPDIQRAAKWTADQLLEFGFESVSVMPTSGHPVVYGEWLKTGADVPTILFYGHYDVQPPDPLDLWTSEPFEPQVRGDNIFARGASDMKGQIIAHLKAVESIIRTSSLPINLKYLIEGEEEIGSPNLGAFIQENRDLLSCNLCLNGDSNILAPDTPSITFALRGLAYFEIRLQGTTGDLHSGMFGGAVDNPAIVLSKLIAGMRDEHGRITLPGFYDHVRPLTDADRAEVASMPDAWWLEQAGAKVLFGEQGFTATERATARPTLDVNGMVSGFTGEGSKTVLPAKAMAKISMRLVPNQRPEMIRSSLETYLNSNAPPTVTWELEQLASCPPVIVERDSDAVRAASRALATVWGVEPVFTRQGGTVPVVGMMQELLGIDSLMLGFGLPDDNLHAPNEKLHLPNFYRGVETYIRFMHEVANKRSR